MRTINKLLIIILATVLFTVSKAGNPNDRVGGDEGVVPSVTDIN